MFFVFCSLFLSIWFGFVSIFRGWLQLPFPSLHWISMSSPSLSFSIYFSVQFPKSKLGNKLPSLRLPVPALWPRARGETRMPTFLFLFSFPMPLPNSNSNSLQFILRPPYSVSTIPRKSRSPRSHLLDLNPNPIRPESHSGTRSVSPPVQPEGPGPTASGGALRTAPIESVD